MKREAKFTTYFHHWLRASIWQNGAFEIKQTLNDSISFSEVKDHQIDALLAVKNSKLIYKIPDDSRGIKPYDMFMLCGAGAYIVIKYPTLFVIIDVEKFVKEKKQSKRKSLTVTRAQEIAARTVLLGKDHKTLARSLFE